LPNNREIKLALKVQWSSRLTLSIIYKIMFITKVDVRLTPSLYIVPKGEDLRVYSGATKIINHDGNTDSHSYSLSWACPGTDLCKYGASNFLNNQYLIIRSDDFLRANLTYWQPYNITAISTSDFIQGDGTWNSRGMVQVVWIPFNPEARIVGDDQISIDQALTAEILTKGLSQDDMIYKWSTEPKVDPKSYLNSDDRRHFVIKPYALIQDIHYAVSVKITLKKSGLAFWNGVKRVKINPPPQNGRLIVSPVQGEAFDSVFKLEAVDWIIRDKPARYQFLYEDNNGHWSPITNFQSANVIQTVLPPTIKVIVKLRDQKSGQAQGSSTVFSALENADKAVKAQTQMFEKAMSQSSRVETMKLFSLIVQNYYDLREPQSTTTARQQASQMISKLGEYQRSFDQVSNEEDKEFQVVSTLAIFAQLSRAENVINLEQMIAM